MDFGGQSRDSEEPSKSPFKRYDAVDWQTVAAAALPNQERLRTEAPREERNRQSPPTSQ
jgi:hypothetical protein